MGLHSPENLDMFDVAVGDCEFSDYLLQRFNALDLQTRVTLDPSDKVEEIITFVPPPPPAPPPPPEVVPQPEVAAEPPPDTDEMARLIANFQAAAALANFNSAVAAFQERVDD